MWRYGLIELPQKAHWNRQEGVAEPCPMPDFRSDDFTRPVVDDFMRTVLA